MEQLCTSLHHPSNEHKFEWILSPGGLSVARKVKTERGGRWQERHIKTRQKNVQKSSVWYLRAIWVNAGTPLYLTSFIRTKCTSVTLRVSVCGGREGGSSNESSPTFSFIFILFLKKKRICHFNSFRKLKIHRRIEIQLNRVRRDANYSKENEPNANRRAERRRKHINHLFADLDCVCFYYLIVTLALVGHGWFIH